MHQMGIQPENSRREKGGWITWFTWVTNKIPRQGICTIYVGPPVPLEYRKVPLLGLLLAWAWKPGQISRFGGHPRSRWEFSQKNGEQKRTTWGNQSFWKLIRFLYFWVCLYTFRYTLGWIHSHVGVSSPDLYQNQVLHIKVHHLLAMSETCWHFMILSFW